MKRILAAASAVAMTAAAAQAGAIGVSMQSFDNNFQTLLREGLEGHAASLGDVRFQIEDAQTDVARPLNQVKNFIASGMDAIIVTLADTSAAPGITVAAMQAGDLDVTVFKNAAGQAKSALATALALAQGKPVERQVIVPFEQVTPQSMAGFAARN